MREDKAKLKDETIRPIKRPRGDIPATVAPVSTNGGLQRWQILIGVSLLVVMLAVLFVLPRVGDEPVELDPQIESTQLAEPMGPPPLSPERRAELEAQAQRDLAKILTQQDALKMRAPDVWGGEGWMRYNDLARIGDDAYLDQDIELAVETYAETLMLGDALLEQSNVHLQAAIDAGGAALAEANIERAQDQFLIALAIEGQNIDALQGQLRANNLSAVLDLMSKGAIARADGDIAVALGFYQEALTLDPLWSPAQRAVDSTQAALTQFRFDSALNSGYAALTSSQFNEAIDAFSNALAIRPGSSDANEGLFQAEEGMRLGQIGLARVRALAFERRELWAEAIAQYESALQIDAALEFAIEGIERARSRHDLELKVLNLLDNPRLLFDDGVLRDARLLREQLATAEPRGTLIDEQLTQFDRLIAAASEPITVKFVSDGLTTVVIYRVGEIGSFLQTEVGLRPGNYTAIGSRDGYRDVRESFIVLPGSELEPVNIVCAEQI